MEVIEKTRWEGDKTVGVKSENKDEESLKRNKFGKTRKDTR